MVDDLSKRASDTSPICSRRRPSAPVSTTTASGRYLASKTTPTTGTLPGTGAGSVEVDQDTLGDFARLYDAPGTPPQAARLPALQAQNLVTIVRKFTRHPGRLADLRNDFVVTRHWDETMAQRDGTIRRQTGFPDKAHDLVLSGPHFFVGNPLNKTPRRRCTTNRSYDVLDLTTIPDDYLPRTNIRSRLRPDYIRASHTDSPVVSGGPVRSPEGDGILPRHQPRDGRTPVRSGR